MRSLRFAAALLAVVLLQSAGVKLLEEFPLAVDLFLILVVFNALDGNTLAGLLGGVSAGLVADALSGSPFGIYGLVDTIIGYGTAYTAQRLVIQRTTGVLLLFALAAAAQQALLIGLDLLVYPEALFSSHSWISNYQWVLVKVITSGLLGITLLFVNTRLHRQLESWKRSRSDRIRFER